MVHTKKVGEKYSKKEMDNKFNAKSETKDIRRQAKDARLAMKHTGRDAAIRAMREKAMQGGKLSKNIGGALGKAQNVFHRTDKIAANARKGIREIADGVRKGKHNFDGKIRGVKKTAAMFGQFQKNVSARTGALTGALASGGGLGDIKSMAGISKSLVNNKSKAKSSSGNKESGKSGGRYDNAQKGATSGTANNSGNMARDMANEATNAAAQSKGITDYGNGRTTPTRGEVNRGAVTPNSAGQNNVPVSPIVPPAAVQPTDSGGKVDVNRSENKNVSTNEQESNN